MKVISLLNEKGGVGKSTTALTLISGLAERDYTVLAIDNDPQGNLSSVLLPKGVESESETLTLYKGEIKKLQAVKPRVWLFTADEKLKDAQFDDNGPSTFTETIKKIERSGKIDYVVIDNSPTITNLTLAGIKAATDYLIVTTPERWGVEGMAKINKTVMALKKKEKLRGRFFGLLINQFNGTKGHRRIHNELRKKYPDLVFETLIKRRVALSDGVSRSQSIFEYLKHGDATTEANAFVSEFLRKMEG